MWPVTDICFYVTLLYCLCEFPTWGGQGSSQGSTEGHQRIVRVGNKKKKINFFQILLVLVQKWLPPAFTTNKGLRVVCVLLRIEHLNTDITNWSWILAREIDRISHWACGLGCNLDSWCSGWSCCPQQTVAPFTLVRFCGTNKGGEMASLRFAPVTWNACVERAGVSATQARRQSLVAGTRSWAADSWTRVVLLLHGWDQREGREWKVTSFAGISSFSAGNGRLEGGVLDDTPPGPALCRLYSAE